MLKIINNRLYDTDKAVLICEDKNEKFYRKKNGEFFLLVDNNDVVIIDAVGAKSWIEKHHPEMYQSIFIDKTAHKPKARVVGFGINEDDYTFLLHLAEQKKLRYSEMCREIFEKGLESYK